MKRFFALLLVVLMLIPAIVSCKPTEGGKDDDSNATSTTEKQEDTSSLKGDKPNPDASSEEEPDDSGKIHTKEDKSTKWAGKTLNVLATKYGDPTSAPWGQLELNPKSFGTGLNTAFEKRQAEIKEIYGVTVKWTAAKQTQSIVDDLAEAENSDTLKYDIALPRVFEVQSLVQSVYNMGNSDYIDFTQSYYSQIAYETFTVAGVTLFATGDYDFTDDQLASVLYFNKDLFSTLAKYDIYEVVDKGEWTFDLMVNISRAVSGDLNNNKEHDDDDRYGFGTKNLANFFQFFGITEASTVNGLFEVTLDKGNPTLVVDKIITCATGGDWCRNEWGGKWGGNMGTAFAQGRLLFYEDVFQSAQNFSNIGFQMGILPFPKLNNEQENYCAPVLAKYQSTVICIPKATQERAMSEYFVDVLSWTGQDYIIPEFLKTIESKLSDDYEEDLRIYDEHIKANMTYDTGVITYGHNTLLGSARADSYSENKDNFNKAFGDVAGTARTTVEEWNTNWAAYSD